MSTDSLIEKPLLIQGWGGGGVNELLLKILNYKILIKAKNYLQKFQYETTGSVRYNLEQLIQYNVCFMNFILNLHLL
jgi:hypothetical protein